MTSTRAIEYRITQQLLHRQQQPQPRRGSHIADRLIGVVSVTALMLLFGSYMPELLWAGLAGAAVLVMGTGGRR